MAARIFSVIAAIGMFAALAAHAQPVSGDIVDQVLQTMPPRPGAALPPPSPATLQPAPQPAAAISGGGDIVDRALQTQPAGPAPFVPWTGFYVGANLGGATTHGGSGVSCTNSLTGDSTGCDVINNGGINASGVFGGGQVGYMAPVSLGQGTSLMLGGEVDLQGTSITGTQNTNGPFAITGFPGFTCSPCNYTASQSLDWFSTVRLRVGVPLDNFLVYGTGGVIVGGVTTSQSLNFSGVPGYVVNSRSALAGPTVGGGVEVLVSGPLSAKLEGLYYDLGTVRTTTLPQGGFGANFSEQRAFGFQGAMIRLGINFRLGDFGAF